MAQLSESLWGFSILTVSLQIVTLDYQTMHLMNILWPQ